MDKETLDLEAQAEDWCASNLDETTVVINRAIVKQASAHLQLQTELKDKSDKIEEKMAAMRRKSNCVDEELQEQADKVVKEFRKVKKARQLGTAILRVDKKVAKGEKLSAEESWLFAKANAQCKTANKMYARESKMLVGNVKKEWGGLKRPEAFQEEDEEGREEVSERSGGGVEEDENMSHSYKLTFSHSAQEEEEDIEPSKYLTIADKRLQGVIGKNDGHRFGYMGDLDSIDKHLDSADENVKELRAKVFKDIQAGRQIEEKF